MKRKVFLAGWTLLAVFSAFSWGAEAPKGLRFSLGINAGGGPTGSCEPTWRTGLEIACRFPGHWALAAGFSYGSLAREASSSLSSYTASEVQAWKDLPIYLMVRYAAFLMDRVAVTLGAGAGYHSLAWTSESETNVLGYAQAYEEESHSQAWAPQAEIGLEIGLSKSLALTGTVRYEFGIAALESTVGSVNIRQESAFGGVSLVLGVRLDLF